MSSKELVRKGVTVMEPTDASERQPRVEDGNVKQTEKSGGLLVSSSIELKNTVYSQFPADLWELILDKLPLSDIKEVLKVHPGLDQDLQARVPEWLIEEVLPILFGNSINTPTDIVAFRKICKCWSDMDKKNKHNFLENHFWHFKNQNDVACLTKAYKDLDYLEWITQDVRDWSPNFPYLRLCNTEQVRGAHEKLKNHPSCHFITRKVSFLNTEWYGMKVHEFMDAVLGFIQEFGKGIYYMELDFGVTDWERTNTDDFCKFFGTTAQMLESVPELRHLAMGLYHVVQNERPIGISARDQTLVSKVNLKKLVEQFGFPALPHLESMNLMHFLYNGTDFTRFIWLDMLNKVKCSSGGIKKLQTCSDGWTHHLKPYLQNVEQLAIVVEGDDDGALTEVLRDMNPEKLKKLRVRHLRHPETIKDFFVTLSEHGPKLEEVEILSFDLFDSILNFNRNGDYVSTTEMVPLPSIQYLCLPDALHLSFDFLKGLFSISHLDVIGLPDDGHHQHNVDEKSLATGALSLSQIIYAYLYLEMVPSNVNIWEVIPSLQLLTVKAPRENCNNIKRFARKYGNKPFYIMK